jgi:pimeloyl-ACP methyl ester carboxylesterase
LSADPILDAPGDPFEHQFVEANGQRFHVASLGEGEKLALCLHGFPECWYSWRHQAPVLAQQGYRVWAPDLRGYGLSSKPTRIADYALEALMDDVAALIEAAGAKQATILAHDWGGLIAWWFAMRRPELVARLVVMNLPHPGAARANAGPRQLRRSWYALFFQLPWLPERLFGRDAKRLPRMFERAAVRNEVFLPEETEVYRKSAAQPGAMRGMVNYYRALVRGGGMRRQRALGIPTLEMPTLLVWGTEDIALGIELTYDTDRYVSDLTLRYVPDVGHWVQLEAAEDVNRILEAWLAGEEVPQLPGAERYGKPSSAG